MTGTRKCGLFLAREFTENSLLTEDTSRTVCLRRFNAADTLNTLLATGGLKQGETYDVDYVFLQQIYMLIGVF